MLGVCLGLCEIGGEGVDFEEEKRNDFTKLKRSGLSMRWRQRLGVWQGDEEAVQEPGLSRERSDGSRERQVSIFISTPW